MSDDIDTIEADDETPVLIAQREDWQKHGACNGTDPEMWFPTRGASVEQARAICDGCPVKTECLDYALRAGEKFGIWGGTSERERRKMRRDGGFTYTRRLVAQCGTNAGHAAHKRDGTEPCAQCRAAHAEYKRLRKAGEIEHGTERGYRAHVRIRGEEACPECKAAHSDYTRSLRSTA